MCVFPDLAGLPSSERQGLETAMSEAVQSVVSQQTKGSVPHGDILCFLPGVAEINKYVYQPLRLVPHVHSRPYACATASLRNSRNIPHLSPFFAALYAFPVMGTGSLAGTQTHHFEHPAVYVCICVCVCVCSMERLLLKALPYDVDVVTLHGSLDPREQDRVVTFKGNGRTR